MREVIALINRERKTTKKSISHCKKVTKISGQDPAITNRYKILVKKQEKYLLELETAIKILKG